MKDRASTAKANKELGPLIDYVKGRRGAVGEVLAKLKQKTGKEWRRENVMRWLHASAKRRTQPLFGVGLILVEIGQEFTQNGKEDHAKGQAVAD